MSRGVTLLECFSEVVDPRDPPWVFHELTDILALAVIAGAEGWEDIEEFGKQKRDWLKKFLRLPNGVPSHDTISRVFRQIKPQAFQAGFTQWIVTGTRNLGVSEPEVLRVLFLGKFCGLGRLRRPDFQNRQLWPSSGI